MATPSCRRSPALTDGELQLEPGTLYRALHRMLQGRLGRRVGPPAGRRSGRRAAALLPADAGRPAGRVGRGRAPVAPGHRRPRPQVAVPCLTCLAEPRAGATREGGPARRVVARLAVSAGVPPRRRSRPGRRARRSDARAPRRRGVQRRRLGVARSPTRCATRRPNGSTTVRRVRPLRAPQGRAEPRRRAAEAGHDVPRRSHDRQPDRGRTMMTN